MCYLMGPDQLRSLCCLRISCRPHSHTTSLTGRKNGVHVRICCFRMLHANLRWYITFLSLEYNLCNNILWEYLRRDHNLVPFTISFFETILLTQLHTEYTCSSSFSDIAKLFIISYDPTESNFFIKNNTIPIRHLKS